MTFFEAYADLLKEILQDKRIPLGVRDEYATKLSIILKLLDEGGDKTC